LFREPTRVSSTIAVAAGRSIARNESPGTVGALFWLQGFLLLQIGCQLALLAPALGALRLVWRCAAFGASLALLVLVRGWGPGHPCRRWAPAILGLTALGFLHPTTNSLAAAAAQWVLYLAILAPLFWAARLSVTPAMLRRLLLLFWLFQTTSAAVGVLQVLYPGRFQPNLSSNVSSLDAGRLDSLKVTLANGERVFRPMGLTDVPGGAASAGMYAVLFGLGFLLIDRRGLIRIAALAGMGVGLFCIYLSQTRSVLIMTGVCVLTLAATLAWRGEWSRLVVVAAVVGAVVVGSFTWAVAVGGKSVTDRLLTLTAERADNVYYRNRGVFLEATINELLPRYPFGAGLGRWGMMNQYFGDRTNLYSEPIWVEIQWTGWLLDGGVALVIAYGGALVLACSTALRIARSRLPGELPLIASLVLAYDIGAAAVTFNYPLFIGQGGLEFWLLNAVLFAAACNAARRPAALPRQVAP
jgi:hypothetical protein